MPIPLLKWMPEPPAKAPMASRQHLISFVGNTMHGPGHPTLRNRMKYMLWSAAKEHNVSTKAYHGSDWRNVMVSSRMSLVPRGNGRTSFHLAETLHLGLVPIYVYSDTPWIPYEHLFPGIGFSVQLNGLPDLIKRLNDHSQQNSSDFNQKLVAFEAQALAFAHSHFSILGVLQQIGLFLVSPDKSDLRCRALPRTPRDMRW